MRILMRIYRSDAWTWRIPALTGPYSTGFDEPTFRNLILQIEILSLEKMIFI